MPTYLIILVAAVLTVISILISLALYDKSSASKRDQALTVASGFVTLGAFLFGVFLT